MKKNNSSLFTHGYFFLSVCIIISLFYTVSLAFISRLDQKTIDHNALNQAQNIALILSEWITPHLFDLDTAALQDQMKTRILNKAIHDMTLYNTEGQFLVSAGNVANPILPARMQLAMKSLSVQVIRSQDKLTILVPIFALPDNQIQLRGNVLGFAAIRFNTNAFLQTNQKPLVTFGMIIVLGSAIAMMFLVYFFYLREGSTDADLFEENSNVLENNSIIASPQNLSEDSLDERVIFEQYTTSKINPTKQFQPIEPTFSTIPEVDITSSQTDLMNTRLIEMYLDIGEKINAISVTQEDIPRFEHSDNLFGFTQNYGELFQYIINTAKEFERMMNDLFVVSEQISRSLPSIINTSNTIKKTTIQLAVESSRNQQQNESVTEILHYAEDLRKLSDTLINYTHSLNSDIKVHLDKIEKARLAVQHVNDLDVGSLANPTKVKSTMQIAIDYVNQKLDWMNRMNSQVLNLQQLNRRLCKTLREMIATHAT